MKTEVSIDNTKLESKIDKDTTLNDIINDVIKHLSTTQKLITSIEIDGKALELSTEKKLLAKSAINFQKINFNAKKGLDITFEALDSCASYIDVINHQIHTLANLYQENKSSDLDNLFVEIVSGLDIFVQLMSNVHRTLRLRFPKQFNQAETIQILEVHLLSITKALMQAKKKNDVIMLCDLLEYELMDNLTKWKIKAIPELKKLKK